jgi:hypothetical protein
MAALGVVGPGGPGHALVLTSSAGVTEVGALPWCSERCAPPSYYDPVGLPLRSPRLHHWLIRGVFADEAAQTGLSCPEPDRACVPIPIPRKDPTKGMSAAPVGRVLPSPWRERLGSLIVNLTRLQDSRRVALRPARLLPPKRLLTPRSARRLSATDRGLLPGSAAFTRAGLAPAGLVQFPGRNTKGS